MLISFKRRYHAYTDSLQLQSSRCTTTPYLPLTPPFPLKYLTPTRLNTFFTARFDLQGTMSNISHVRTMNQPEQHSATPPTFNRLSLLSVFECLYFSLIFYRPLPFRLQLLLLNSTLRQNDLPHCKHCNRSQLQTFHYTFTLPVICTTPAHR